MSDSPENRKGKSRLRKTGRRGKRSAPQGPRAAALLALLDIEAGRRPEEALEGHGAGLDRRDRALAQALVFGVCRWRSLLEWRITHFLSRPKKSLDPAVRNILNLGLFQLEHLDRVPVPAAVSESVTLARDHGPPYAPGLVNAVLRAWLRSEARPDPDAAGLEQAERLALKQAHPHWLVERWLAELGPLETECLLAANNTPAPLALRINPARTTTEVLARLLESRAEKIEPAPLAPDGLLLHGPTGPVTGLPGYQEGFFSVQDEASQIVGLLAVPAPGGLVLDACAGLGGKALHLATLAQGPVVGLDPDGKKLEAARREARRLGAADLHLVRGDLLHPPFRPASFDVVLVDAPCSNLGVIRRRPDVKWSKTAADPARLSETQKRLLAAAAGLVRSGGRLVYSVCTLTREETVEVVEAFRSGHTEFKPNTAADYLPPRAAGLAGSDGLLRAWPHRHGADGFFAAVFQRTR
ncbi:MAG: 16S rRNA (cytosine(967)-C(5))-methyltransferase RsmB [Thermodesulfobacteriota bacterium]